MEQIIKLKGKVKQRRIVPMFDVEEQFCTLFSLGLTMEQYDSLMDQRHRFLMKGFPIKDIKIEIEIIPDFLDTEVKLLGHEVFLVTS